MMDLPINMNMLNSKISESSDVTGNNREDLKMVAKELESIFAMQLMKVMRESTAGLSDEQKGTGYNNYMSMFDVEISKLLAERGLGLQDSIIASLETMQGIETNDISEGAEKGIKDIRDKADM
ncbi:MAG: hypothetical protein ISR96_00755 [Nitrospira sp.]|nr:hypothetical protein [bacterium]MBL7048044.1 hypothetical protein [Nitrospira sp.]